MQATLFGAPAATNGFRDSSFAKNKSLPLHRWVPWIAGFSGRAQLFSPEVERKILYRLDFLNAVHGRTLRVIFRLGLGSVMVSFSNYSYQPSLARRASVGKPNIKDADVGLSVSAKLHL